MFSSLYRLLCEVGSHFGWRPPVKHIIINVGQMKPGQKVLVWPEGMNSIGPRIRHLRKLAGLSTHELANDPLVEISDSYLNRLEQPLMQANPTLDVLRRLAFKLDIGLGDLMAGTEWPEPELSPLPAQPTLALGGE